MSRGFEVAQTGKLVIVFVSSFSPHNCLKRKLQEAVQLLDTQKAF